MNNGSMKSAIIGGMIGVMVASSIDKKKEAAAYTKGYRAACDEMKNYIQSDEGGEYIKEVVDEILNKNPSTNDTNQPEEQQDGCGIVEKAAGAAKKELTSIIETFWRNRGE